MLVARLLRSFSRWVGTLLQQELVVREDLLPSDSLGQVRLQMELSLDSEIVRFHLHSALDRGGQESLDSGHGIEPVHQGRKVFSEISEDSKEHLAVLDEVVRISFEVSLV